MAGQVTSRRVAWLLAAAVLLPLAWLLLGQYRIGAAVDQCATQLAEAAHADDAAALSTLVPSRALRSTLLAADELEVAYARAASAGHTRVGMVVRTGTVAALVVLLLNNQALPTCRFLKDYEPSGPFGT